MKQKKTSDNLVPVKIKVSDPKFIPKYANEFAACADLFANINEGTTGAKFSQDFQDWVIQIPPRTVVKIDTGFAMQLPVGWKAEISQRSGKGQEGFIITNAPGQIDEDYRGPIGVLLSNVSQNILVVKNGDRIGQMYPVPVFKFKWECVETLEKTERGENGFGSTGK